MLSYDIVNATPGILEVFEGSSDRRLHLGASDSINSNVGPVKYLGLGDWLAPLSSARAPLAICLFEIHDVVNYVPSSTVS